MGCDQGGREVRVSQPTLMSLLQQLATGAAGSAGVRGRWGSRGCGGGVVAALSSLG